MLLKSPLPVWEVTALGCSVSVLYGVETPTSRVGSDSAAVDWAAPKPVEIPTSRVGSDGPILTFCRGRLS